MPGAPVVDLFGALTGLCRHPTGVLVPLGTRTLDQYTTWPELEDGVPDPVASFLYDAPEIAAGFNGAKRLWATIQAPLIAGQAGPVSTVSLAEDAAPLGGSYSGTFSPLAGSASVYAASIRMRITGSVAQGTEPYLSVFKPAAQAAEYPPQSGTVAIPSGGSLAIAFSPAFHRAPDVTVSPVGNAVPQFASALDVTTTGFTLQLLDVSGSPTAGNASYNASGA